MSKEVITFGEIEKPKFTAIKTQYFLKDVIIDNMLISNKISSGEKNYKYFIGYIDWDYKNHSYY